MNVLDERRRSGVRVNAWLAPDTSARGQGGKRALMRALGLRSKRVQPVQARAKGSALVVRMEAHYSPHGSTSKGALRSYLERAEARGPETRRSTIRGTACRTTCCRMRPSNSGWIDGRCG